MKKSKSLSARTVNKYVEYIRQVVASLKHGETGEPIHKRTWDSSVMDLPMVNQKEQRQVHDAAIPRSTASRARHTPHHHMLKDKCGSSRCRLAPGRCGVPATLYWRQTRSIVRYPEWHATLATTTSKIAG